MIPQEHPTDEEKKAIVAVINWRAKDRIALANRRDRDAQRDEYKQRGNLRQAADQLKGQP